MVKPERMHIVAELMENESQGATSFPRGPRASWECPIHRLAKSTIYSAASVFRGLCVCMCIFVGHDHELC